MLSMGSDLEVANKESALRVALDTVPGDKSSRCSAAVKKTNSMQGLIRKSVKVTACVIMPLCKSMVSQHLEYCVQFWLSHLKMDVAGLEKVQGKKDTEDDQRAGTSSP